jgi:structure-specific recognition protein 1
MVIRLIIFPNNGQLQNPGKKDFKREVSSSKAVTKRKSRDGEESQKKRKPKKKKDPNAPKRSKSAYVFFSQMEREVG